MATEVENYVEGLSGSEIIIDVLSQVEARLQNDCNLRHSDSYPGGYEGEVTVRLKCYGLDSSDVVMTVPIKSEKVTRPSSENQLVETAVDETVKIPVDPALDMVRERSGQPIPTMSRDESGQPKTNYRRYAKHPPTGGGATGESL